MLRDHTRFKHIVRRRYETLAVLCIDIEFGFVFGDLDMATLFNRTGLSVDPCRNCQDIALWPMGQKEISVIIGFCFHQTIGLRYGAYLDMG